MKNILFGLLVIPLLTNGVLAMQPLSDLQLEKITAGALNFPSFANVPGLGTLPALSASSSSVSLSPTFADATSQAGLGEAGLIGAARLGEYFDVVQFLNH